MKFTSSLALVSILAFAAAQTDSPLEQCLDACPVSDVACKASCNSVPAPNEDMANDTTECAANCDQGSGSPSDTEAFAQCVQNCISQNFYTPNGNPSTPKATGKAATAASAASAATDAAATGAARVSSAVDGVRASASGAVSSALASGSAAVTSAASEASESAAQAAASSTGAAQPLQIGGSTLGFVGVIAALFAL
ncbi:MAG: hypothetical protein M1833_002529 [Piccolia ochrophora]|nr:MAG: hypothetical protein M1833_002529 [Piccolia ochrophora]